MKVAVVNRSNFIVGSLAFPDNPYNGHTLAAQLRHQVEQFTGKKPGELFVDCDHCMSDSQVFVAGQKRGVNARLKCLCKRKQAIESVTEHIERRIAGA